MVNEDDDLLEAVGRLADEVLWPAALSVDRATSIPRGHYDAIADLGLFAMLAPADLGGLGYGRERVRRVLRVLGGGCGATAFAFAQHGGVVAALSATANSPLRDRWLPALCDRSLGGTAFAHVRRAGAAAVRAERFGGGWRIDGLAPWATSWGTAEVFTVAATTTDDEMLWFLLPVGDGVPATIEASRPMELVTLDASETVSLRFSGHRVGDDDVLSVGEAAVWRVGDRRGAVRPNPLCIGVGDRALTELREAAPESAASLEGWWASFAEQVMEAEVVPPDVDAPDDGVAELEEREIARVAAARSSSVFATQRLTTALLASVGGRGADRNHVAQLLARVALFYVIQAQNDDGRRATLDGVVAASLAEPSRSTSPAQG
jgi:alkylation response protein AidB-like acyl-CoA dehydrogenase